MRSLFKRFQTAVSRPEKHFSHTTDSRARVTATTKQTDININLWTRRPNRISAAVKIVFTEQHFRVTFLWDEKRLILGTGATHVSVEAPCPETYLRTKSKTHRDERFCQACERRLAETIKPFFTIVSINCLRACTLLSST